MKIQNLLKLIYKAPILTILLLIIHFQGVAQLNYNNQQLDGYKGIWFTLGQFYEYGDKYSGGLGTYTAKHKPLAIYAEEVNRTFFVYGGTTGEDDRYLLCMIGSFNHANSTVTKPVVVYDKQGVDDPHDNPSLLIDPEGYLWVFISGRNTRRPGFKYRSDQPYDISGFTQVTQEEMTYPQPWPIEGKGIFHFFTKYTGVRELYYETSPDGQTWTEDRKLAGIIGEGEEKAGHYQVSGHYGGKVATFFSRHPNGNVDRRTSLHYLQSTDFGETWTTADGEPVETPVTDVDSPARVIDYESQGKNVYLKDMSFDADGNPVALYLTSGGHEPGPDNNPREWRVSHYDGSGWQTSVITTSGHNYDMGSLWIDGNRWTVIAPTVDGPQRHGAGGEVAIWVSINQGKSWSMQQQITQDSPRNHNYVRRVVNGQPPFQYFWADGNPGGITKSVMYFGDSEGNTWQLPYEMSEEEVRIETQ
ncbi:MAG: BNR-4 repeat-containing protein [Tunicatimonas sp.]|uniref:BNR-4 repeat-containing protein n=1 Tax=Tunicatimonas sp. TaxID=1940096 RepID=UPI003C7166A1